MISSVTLHCPCLERKQNSPSSSPGTSNGHQIGQTVWQMSPGELAVSCGRSRVTTQVLGVAKQGRFQLLYLLTVRSSSCGSCLQGSEGLSWSKCLPPCLFVFVPFLPGWPGEGRGPKGGLSPTVARLCSPRRAPASHIQAGKQAEH